MKTYTVEDVIDLIMAGFRDQASIKATGKGFVLALKEIEANRSMASAVAMQIGVKYVGADNADGAMDLISEAADNLTRLEKLGIDTAKCYGDDQLTLYREALNVGCL